MIMSFLKWMRIPVRIFVWVLMLMYIPLGWADSSIEAQHIESARGYMNAGQWDYAAYEWRAALTQNPRSLEASMGLAENLMRSGYLMEAIRHLEGLRQDVENLSLELMYGSALEQAGQTVMAGKVYLHNLQRNPLEAESFRRLVLLLPRVPEADQASLKKLLEQTASIASQKGKEALKARQYKAASMFYALSTSFAPTPMDLNDYALTLLLQDQYDAAVGQFAMLDRLETKPWNLHANFAFVALGKGNPIKAAESMGKAISLCSDVKKKPLLYNGLGFIYERQGKWQQARHAYEHAVELDATFTKAKLNLAYAYQKDMAYDKAIDTYRNVLMSDPGNTKVLNRLGFVYELAHKDKQA